MTKQTMSELGDVLADLQTPLEDLSLKRNAARTSSRPNCSINGAS